MTEHTRIDLDNPDEGIRVAERAMDRKKGTSAHTRFHDYPTMEKSSAFISHSSMKIIKIPPPETLNIKNRAVVKGRS